MISVQLNILRSFPSLSTSYFVLCGVCGCVCVWRKKKVFACTATCVSTPIRHTYVKRECVCEREHQLLTQHERWNAEKFKCSRTNNLLLVWHTKHILLTLMMWYLAHHRWIKLNWRKLSPVRFNYRYLLVAHRQRNCIDTLTHIITPIVYTFCAHRELMCDYTYVFCTTTTNRSLSTEMESLFNHKCGLDSDFSKINRLYFDDERNGTPHSKELLQLCVMRVCHFVKFKL